MNSPERMAGSLLPANASKLERDLARVIDTSLDLPLRINELWDPYSCPLSLLPWLAWAFSVDLWDDRWPESIKRQVVQDAFEVHRFKGTPYAIQQALDSLNIRTQLREWWAPDGSQQPGTATVVALVNENLTDDDDALLTKAMLEQVTQVIGHAKRGVIHVDVELGIALEESMGLAAALGPAQGYIDHSAALLPVLPDRAAGDIGAGAVGYRTDGIDQEASFSPLLPDALHLRPQLSGVCQPLYLSDIHFEGTV